MPTDAAPFTATHLPAFSRGETLLKAVLFLVAISAPQLATAQSVQKDPLSQLEQHQQKLFERIAPSVVFIANGRGFGSGFFVNTKGLVLTSAHVVGKANQVNVVVQDGRKLTAKVVARAKNDIDLAQVQVPLRKTPSLVLSGVSGIRVGSWVASVGHGRGGIWTFNVGMVSNIYPDGSERPVFQTQIPLNPGSSGGPIVDREGRVVGIVTAGLTNSNSINFGIKADVAFKMLPSLRTDCSCIKIHAPDGVAVFVNGAHVGNGPLVTVAATPGTYNVFAVINGTMVKKSLRYPNTSEVRLGGGKGF